jgi:hypothetical protein
MEVERKNILYSIRVLRLEDKQGILSLCGVQEVV